MNSSYKTNNSTVCIQKCSYQNIDLNSLVKPLGGFSEFINKGERVLLKINLLNATEPNKAVVTNPKVIEAVVEEIYKTGGEPIIGDSPSGPFTKRRLQKVYNKAGLINLSNNLGVKLNFDTKYKKVNVADGKRLKNTLICDFFLNADKIITIPKIKTHSLMMMTLATKIMYGVIPGLTKVRYHSKYIRRKAFAEMLIDVLSVVNPNLIIMDGIVGMQGDGPAGGNPVELGVILASDESVAMDLAVCRMLDIEPIGIPTLKEAKIRNMWPNEIAFPLLSPDDVKYKKFILPSTAGHLLTGEKKPEKYPIIMPNCTACGECVEICPRKAIKIKNNKAQVSYSKCIKCYCCHEICEYNAIELEIIK